MVHITTGWKLDFLDFLKEKQLRNATKNSDVAKVEIMGELLIPLEGYLVSFTFPFLILWGCPDSSVTSAPVCALLYS